MDMDAYHSAHDIGMGCPPAREKAVRAVISPIAQEWSYDASRRQASVGLLRRVPNVLGVRVDSLVVEPATALPPSGTVLLRCPQLETGARTLGAECLLALPALGAPPDAQAATVRFDPGAVPFLDRMDVAVEDPETGARLDADRLVLAVTLFYDARAP